MINYKNCIKFFSWTFLAVSLICIVIAKCEEKFTIVEVKDNKIYYQNESTTFKLNCPNIYNQKVKVFAYDSNGEQLVLGEIYSFDGEVSCSQAWMKNATNAKTQYMYSVDPKGVAPPTPPGQTDDKSLKDRYAQLTEPFICNFGETGTQLYCKASEAFFHRPGIMLTIAVSLMSIGIAFLF